MATSPNGAPNVKFGAALTFVQQFLGYLVNEVESFPTIPASSPTSPFLPQNGDRVGLLIANTGLNNAFIGLGPTVGGNFGFFLVANGGAIAFNVRDDFTLTTRSWWGASIGASNIFYVLEIIGVKALGPGTQAGTQ